MRNRLLWIFGGLLLLGVVLKFAGVGMTREDLHISAAAEPLACFNGVREGELCASGVPITNSLVMTVIVDLVLLGLVVAGVGRMQMVPRGLQNVLEIAVEGLYNFARGIDRKNVGKFFALPATIFFFFLTSNLLALVPLVGSVGVCETVVHTAQESTATAAAEATPAEPSLFASLPGYCGHTDGEGHEQALIPLLRAPAADLNVTVAFSLVAMFMVEFYGFQALGLGYLTKFFNFKEGALGFFVGLIELISEFSRIISFAFRMFGNIFGGEVILVVMSFLFPYILPLPFYGFELFVAIMQSLIFAILTLIFFSTAVVAHSHEDEHGHEETVQVESDVAAHHA